MDLREKQLDPTTSPVGSILMRVRCGKNVDTAKEVLHNQRVQVQNWDGLSRGIYLLPIQKIPLGGPDNNSLLFLFLVINVIQIITVWTSLEKQLDRTTSRGGPYQYSKET